MLGPMGQEEAAVPPSSGWLSGTPAGRAGIWDRPRLNRRLDGLAASSRVILVTAPSGYGKTAALAAWARSRPEPVAWVTLTPLESTGLVVDLLLTQALREVGQRPGASEGVRSLLELPTPGSAPDERWRGVRSALVGLSEPVTLVVDDCDEAAEASRDSLLTALVEHGPPLLRIVLVGRQAPSVRLTRARVQGELGTLGVAELAFRPEETAGLAGTLGRDLPPEELEQLHAWTHGWPVAVHLGLLEPSGGPFAASSAGFAHRVLSALVAEHILPGLPEHLRQFVLATTTVSSTDAALAEELSGRPDSAALLEECVQRELFLDRDEVGASRYRWHSLFAELCRAALKARDPERAGHLHRTAAFALARWGYPLKAAEHALDAADYDLAASILRSRWLWAVLETRGPEAARALERVCARPDADPSLLLAHACTLDITGDRSGARSRYAEAQRAMAAAGEEPDGLVAAMRALAELILSDSADQLALAADVVHDALRLDSFLEESTRAVATFVLGWTELRLRRRPGQAAELLAEAAMACDRTGQREIAVRALLNLALATALDGDFEAALKLLDTAAGTELPERAWAVYDGGIEPFVRGFVGLHRHELDDAEEHFRVGLAEHPQSAYTPLSLVHLALVAAARGEPRALDEAEEGLRQMRTTEERGVPWRTYQALAHCSLRAAASQLDEAVAVLDAMPVSAHTPIVDTVAARLLERAGRPQDAMAALGRIPPEAAGFVRAHGLVTQALMHRAGGRTDVSHRLLEDALDLAAPQSARSPFGGGDERLVQLLIDHAVWGTRHEQFLAQQLLILAGGPDPLPLSPREGEILAYLRTPMTTSEIAAALFVSVNTVKTHQRAIYRKLGVTSRREAVQVDRVDRGVASYRLRAPSTGVTSGGVQPSMTSGRGR